MEESIPILADSIYRERVLRARSVDPSKKMGWGGELYSEVLGRMRSGIRAQFPNSSDSDVERILRERLDRLTKVEEHGLYQPAPRRQHAEA